MIKHCEKHGDYEAEEIDLFGKKIYSLCPECEADQAKAEEAERKQKEALRLEELIKDSGIPLLFRNCTIDNYRVNCIDQERVLRLCRDYIAMFDNALYSSPLFLVGAYGTGKTHLAIGILKRLLFTEKITTGLYVTTMRMIRDIRSSYHSSCKETEQQIIDRYVDKGLLVLDEVGVQNNTDSERLLIYEVLNGRYENRLPTILISNFSVSEIKDYLGARVFDRLQGKNKMLGVFDWGSERGKDT